MNTTNRQFKLRVWDGKFQYLTIDGNSTIFKLNSVERLPFEIQQFTGLQDKNGKDIYEGDILLDKDQLLTGIWYKVIFDKGWFIAEYTNEKGEKFKKDIDTTEFLIMGNEFENPELLQEKT